MISADSYHQCKIIYILITALLPDAVFSIPPLGEYLWERKQQLQQLRSLFRQPQQTDDHKARPPVSTLLWV
jgi:hypothetical protein